MDFTNRGQQFQPNPENSQNKQPDPYSHVQPNNKKSSKIPHRSKLLKIFQFSLLVCIAILVAGILLSIATYKKDGADKYVDTGKYQAVFLNGGQVYFGKIVDLNNNYMSLADIYYLTPNRPVQSDSNGNNAASNNFTIRKLGCEIHRPQNVMVLNNDQIIFWENLKDDDNQNTVPGAIKQLAEQPQDCEAPTNTSTPSSSSSEATDSNNAATDSNNTTTDNSNTDNTPAANNNAGANTDNNTGNTTNNANN